MRYGPSLEWEPTMMFQPRLHYRVPAWIALQPPQPEVHSREAAQSQTEWHNMHIAQDLLVHMRYQIALTINTVYSLQQVQSLAPGKEVCTL